MLRRNKLFYLVLLCAALVLILIFSKNYNAVFVDELIYGRWIYKMVFEKAGFMFTVYLGKQPLFFWVNGLVSYILSFLPFHKIAILNVLKTTAIFNLLITVFGLSLYFQKKSLKLIIPLIFVLGPFFLIYFSIGTVENIIIPLAVLYWFSLGKTIDSISHKKNWWKYYLLNILIGLMVALTKSNAASVIIASLVIGLFYIFKVRGKNLYKWVAFLFFNGFFLVLNLYIAFHFAGTESNNVLSFSGGVTVFFNSAYHLISYIPYFFSFSFLLLMILALFYWAKKKKFLFFEEPLTKVIIVNLAISVMMVIFLEVFYPRYFVISFLALFLLIGKLYEKTGLNIFYKNKTKWLFVFLFVIDLIFVIFPSSTYRWRIPEIDQIQHFDRSSVHIPYDFKKDVIDKNPEALFLINDDRYGANNLFFSLIPLFIKKPNFEIKIYENIAQLNSKSICQKYSYPLIYIWRDFSINRSKNLLSGFLLKSYYPFDYNKYREALMIYKIDCANL